MRTLITGATSGIGEACARLLASKGHELLLLGRREDRLRALAQELQAEFKVRVTPARVDVSSGDEIADFARQYADALAKTDVLINSAGLALGLAKFQNAAREQWDAMIDTNFKGLVAMTHAVLPHFLTRKSGHIVNLGSVAGHYTYPNGTLYCATKYAVRAFTEALRLDLLGSGIRVTDISPGMVNTEFSTVRLGDRNKADAVYAGMTPLTAVDIAETVVWCLERPRHVNIQDVVIYPTDQASPTHVHRR